MKFKINPKLQFAIAGLVAALTANHRRVISL